MIYFCSKKKVRTSKLTNRLSYDKFKIKKGNSSLYFEKKEKQIKKGAKKRGKARLQRGGLRKKKSLQGNRSEFVATKTTPFGPRALVCKRERGRDNHQAISAVDFFLIRNRPLKLCSF
jgi:hypothetical protein